MQYICIMYTYATLARRVLVQQSAKRNFQQKGASSKTSSVAVKIYRFQGPFI